MSFTAWYYLFFLAGVVLLYWRLPHRGRIWLLLAASYVFYGYWDVRFLSLIMASTAMDFFCGQGIDGKRRGIGQVIAVCALPLIWLAICTKLPGVAPLPAVFLWAGAGVYLAFIMVYRLLWSVPQQQRSRYFLILALVYNLGLLSFFKYFNFFVDSARQLFAVAGFEVDATTLNILLPVGISFYTFQSIAYAVDIYRGQQRACTDLPLFAAFISFFPQLVAGPIERAAHLLPQLATPQAFRIALIHEGMVLLLVGYFKKVFVSDNCAVLANYFFNGSGQTSAGWVILGTLAFAFQIYGDFSGYTDMARGSARLLGVDLSRNFRFPYLAVSPSDFWKRWHISLSTWIRDYLYIPLGGNRGGAWFTLRNLYVSMLLAGLWHGAAWNFVLWGAFHATLLAIYRFVPGLAAVERSQGWVRAGAIAGMFSLTLMGWLIFRSPNLPFFEHALASLFGGFPAPAWGRPLGWLLLQVAPLMILQWVTRRHEDEAALAHRSWQVRALDYGVMLILVGSTAAVDQEFIYFQF